MPTSAGDAEKAGKAKQRKYERQSRERRKIKMEAMRQRVEVLECVVANAMFVRDADDVWDEFRSDEATRVRSFLQRSLVLTEEAQRLSRANAELAWMLHEHRLAAEVVSKLMHSAQVDEWDCLRDHWRATLRAHLKEWTPSACRALFQRTLAEISAFPWSAVMRSSGQSCMGWEGKRRFDEDTSSMQFSFAKTVFDDAELRTEQAWAQQTDVDAYMRIILGPNCKAHLDVVQHVTPDSLIVHVVEQRPNSSYRIHAVNLVSRIRTKNVYIQIVRTINTPETERAIDDDNSVWNNHFFCVVCDQFVRSSVNGAITQFRILVTGSVNSFSAVYADLGLTGMITSLVRADTEARKRPLLEAT